MKKSGQGLSMNTIIIAALVLIVFVVIIIIFTSRSRSFSENLNECKSLGGECTFSRQCAGAVVPCECDDIPLRKQLGSWTAVSTGEEPVCCVGGLE